MTLTTSRARRMAYRRWGYIEVLNAPRFVKQPPRFRKEQNVIYLGMEARIIEQVWLGSKPHYTLDQEGRSLRYIPEGAINTVGQGSAAETASIAVTTANHNPQSITVQTTPLPCPPPACYRWVDWFLVVIADDWDANLPAS